MARKQQVNVQENFVKFGCYTHRALNINWIFLLLITIYSKIQSLGLSLVFIPKDNLKTTDSVTDIAYHIGKGLIFGLIFDEKSSSTVLLTIFAIFLCYLGLLLFIDLWTLFVTFKGGRTSKTLQNFRSFFVYIHSSVLAMPIISFNLKLIKICIQSSVNQFVGQTGLIVGFGTFAVVLTIFITILDLLIFPIILKTEDRVSTKSKGGVFLEFILKQILVLLYIFIPDSSGK
jgi:hypothetical protein